MPPDVAYPPNREALIEQAEGAGWKYEGQVAERHCFTEITDAPGKFGPRYVHLPDEAMDCGCVKFCEASEQRGLFQVGPQVTA